MKPISEKPDEGEVFLAGLWFSVCLPAGAYCVLSNLGHWAGIALIIVLLICGSMIFGSVAMDWLNWRNP